MIFELDCGNSLIKWRLMRRDQVIDSGGVETVPELFVALQERAVTDLRQCRMVSVRSEEETAELKAELLARFPLDLYEANSSAMLAGVRNGYRDYQRLGADRWLGLVAGYRLAGRACMVLSLGTTVTCDLVDDSGQHLGGYIAPGLPLMRHELLTNTGRVRYDLITEQQEPELPGPGQSTAEAVERGCQLMIMGFVASQTDWATEHLGEDFAVYLTGGDAQLAARIIPQANTVPDLIFQGLALACPLMELE